MLNNTNLPESPDNESIKSPISLTIRDVVFIIVAVLSMATAWGMFGTRLSVVEEKVISIGDNIVQIRQTIKELKKDMHDADMLIQEDFENLEIRLRIIENQQAELKVLLNAKKK